jgi:DNA-binding beta-propeller fold protein YncE
MMRLVRISVERVVFAALISTTAIACNKKTDDPINNTPPLSDEIATVEPLARAETFAAPLDGAPNPTGDTVAFTAMTEDGAAVFTIPVAGGTATRLVAGDPLTAPFGVVFSSDGNRIYVADSGAEADATSGVGRIFGLPTVGGTLDTLQGGVGMSPRSLDLIEENGVDTIYFTGVNNKAAAVMKMTADGNNMQVVASGAPLVDPSGVTVDAKGVVYVADSSGENGATLYKIDNGFVSEVASGMRFGHPAGIALVPSETAVLISGLDVRTGKSTVYKVEIATGMVASFNSGIAENSDSAGLHRARKASVYAWANAAGGSQRETLSPGGTVYVLKGP